MKRTYPGQIIEVRYHGEIAPGPQAIRRTQTSAWTALAFGLGCALVFGSNACRAAPSFTSLYTFSNDDDGEIPVGLAAINGKLYGIANEGGSANEGALFVYDLKRNSISPLVQFGLGDTGINPNFITVSGTNLFVSTESGTVYEYDTATQTGQDLYQFSGTAGTVPNPVLLVNGTLYGTALLYRQESTLFDIDLSTGAETTLDTLTGWRDGGAAGGALVYQNGIFYGAVAVWKNYQVGGIFSYDPATGLEKVIYHFRNNGKNGAQPAGITYCNGLLYGVNNGGGSAKQGNVFSYNPATGAEKTLYNFSGPTDGVASFSAPVCIGTTLYGIASNGGVNNYGVVYSVSATTGQETVLHSFAGSDGAFPVSLIAKDGVLYGTTEEGADGNGLGLTGTIFQVVP